jgi:hypothetical protein
MVLPNQTSISTRMYLQYATLRRVVVIKESSAATHIYESKERQQVSRTFLLSRPRRLMVKNGGTSSCFNPPICEDGAA